MGKGKDLSDFDKGQIVMARRLGQSISQAAGLVGCSRSAVVSTYRKWSKEGPPVNQRLGHGRPKLIDEHGEQKLAHLVQSNKQATVAELAEKVNAGREQKVSEHTVHRSLLRMGLGRRVVKDTKKPKARTSAYAFFVLSCRDELKRKSPDTQVNLSMLSKKCSEEWKALSPDEKKKFEDMAKADKAHYDEEVKNYIPPIGSEEKKIKKEGSIEPKRPLSAFFIFCAKHRNTVKSEFPNLSIAEIAKKLVEMWSNLSAKERSAFEQKAILLREKQAKDGGLGLAGGSTKAAQTEDDKDEEETDEEEDVEDEDEEEDEDDEEEDDKGAAWPEMSACSSRTAESS